MIDFGSILIFWLINAAAILITAYILPGTRVDNFWAAMVTSLVLGLVNALVRPLIVFLTIPFTIITFGLFIFVINALMIELTSAIVPGFKVESFGNALVFAIVLSLINGALFYIFV